MADDVVVATITLARTPGEEELLYESIRTLSLTGLFLVVADGGSSSSFRERMSALSNVQVLTCPSGGGLVRQVKTAITTIFETRVPEWILYTEPDKQDFFRGAMVDLLKRRLNVSNSTGLILASRTAAAFKTFPDGQQLTESLTNAWTGQSLGTEGDYTYGPFLVRHTLAELALDAPDDLGWGWRFYLFGRAFTAGQGMVHHAVDTACPKGQRGEDDSASRSYRVRQLAQNASGLALGLMSRMTAAGSGA